MLALLAPFLPQFRASCHHPVHPKYAFTINSAMIAIRKKPACGEEEDEGKGAGWVLASVKFLGGGRKCLVLLGKIRVLFPEANV